MGQHGFLFARILVLFKQIRHSLVNHGMILSLFDYVFYCGRACFSFSMESYKSTIMDERLKIGVNQEWSTAGVAGFRSIRLKLAGSRQVVVPLGCLCQSDWPSNKHHRTSNSKIGETRCDYPDYCWKEVTGIHSGSLFHCTDHSGTLQIVRLFRTNMPCWIVCSTSLLCAFVGSPSSPPLFVLFVIGCHHHGWLLCVCVCVLSVCPTWTWGWSSPASKAMCVVGMWSSDAHTTIQTGFYWSYYGFPITCSQRGRIFDSRILSEMCCALFARLSKSINQSYYEGIRPSRGASFPRLFYSYFRLDTFRAISIW